MAIINDDQLKADSVEVMVENFDMDRKVVLELLDNDMMAKIVDRMYRAQESFLEDLFLAKRRREKVDGEE